jgi:hypothetical protein
MLVSLYVWGRDEELEWSNQIVEVEHARSFGVTCNNRQIFSLKNGFNFKLNI